MLGTVLAATCRVASRCALGLLMVNDNVRIDVGATYDISWYVLHARVLLDSSSRSHGMVHYRTSIRVLSLRVIASRRDLTCRELLQVLGCSGR